jgi:quercetin dioxygenase-like cupin family protein
MPRDNWQFSRFSNGRIAISSRGAESSFISPRETVTRVNVISKSALGGRRPWPDRDQLRRGILCPRFRSGPDREHMVFSSTLENAPGSRLTAVVVRYGPGEKSPAHHHAGSVFAYVLSGSIRSENSATGPVRIYKTGEGFFEPVGSVHSISENASPTQPASLLAVFVAPDGAQLTAPEQH